MPDVNESLLSGPVDGASRRRPRKSAPPGFPSRGASAATPGTRRGRRADARGGRGGTAERAVAKGRPATAGGRYGQDGTGRGETVAGGREGNPRTLREGAGR